MMDSRLSLIAAALVASLATCLAQSLYHDERCQIIQGNGVRVDQCDSTRLLYCNNGRCQCTDPATQVYTYRNEVVQARLKRSPGKKGGGFKKIAAGAVAGAATYHVASNAGSAIRRGFVTTPPPLKYKKVYSCYSRVGGQCAMSYNNWETIDNSSTTTTSTTVAPETSSSTVSTSQGLAADNATTAATTTTTPASTTTTTTTAAPTTIAPAKMSQRDIDNMAKCVQNAVCKSGTPAPSGNNPTSASDGFKQTVNTDPRVGVCECETGYKKSSRDLCVKA